MLPACFILLLLVDSSTGTRVVATFDTQQAAQAVTSVPNGTIIKQYGRRIVIDLGDNLSLDDATWMKDELGAVDIELDTLITPTQLDDLVFAEYISLSVDNATFVSEASIPSNEDWNLLDSEPYSIHAESAWKITNSTPNIVVAVLDTGMPSVAYSQFRNIVQGYDFISDPSISLDGNGRDADTTDPGTAGPSCPVSSWHGLKTASILAADHASGVRGVAQNCSLMMMRVLGMCSSGYASDVSDAIVWSAGGVIDGLGSNPAPAQVISMSFAGKGGCPSYLQSSINHAVGLGALLISAAGNQGLNTTDYFPANCRGVMAITATTREGKLAGYSNYGLDIALSAPGGDGIDPILMLSLDDTGSSLLKDFGMGTSFAVPHVAGVAALVLGLRELTGTQVWNFLLQTSTQSQNILSASRLLYLMDSQSHRNSNPNISVYYATYNSSQNVYKNDT